MCQCDLDTNIDVGCSHFKVSLLDPLPSVGLEKQFNLCWSFNGLEPGGLELMMRKLKKERG